jgi:hypothetical protein
MVDDRTFRTDWTDAWARNGVMAGLAVPGVGELAENQP